MPHIQRLEISGGNLVYQHTPGHILLAKTHHKVKLNSREEKQRGRPARLSLPGIFPALALNIPCPQSPPSQANHKGWSPWEQTHLLTGEAAKSRCKVQGEELGRKCVYSLKQSPEP